MFGNSKKIETHKVYGVSNEYVDSYIHRPAVDEAFLKGLKTNKHIIVYGSSKQGKTSLTNEHMKDNEFVRIDCAPNSSLTDIYKSILRQLHIDFVESRTESHSNEGKAEVRASVKFEIPLIGGIDGGANIEGGGGKQESTKYKTIDFNLSLAQDISEVLQLKEFSGRIILENFHYLDVEQQRQLAFDLRIFEDKNILFVILGIWKEKNRLPQYNGDLLDRLVEIPVEPWSTIDLKRVIEEGQPILNVSFDAVSDKLINSCYGSIGVLQELLKHSCYAAGVENNMDKTFAIEYEHVESAIQKKVSDYSSRHTRCIETFIEQRTKSRDDDNMPLKIPYYFIKAVFEDKFNDLENGVQRKDIHEAIQENHHRPDDVRASDLSHFLYNIVPMQVKKSIIPPIFYYDRDTQRLGLVDSTFYFYLNYCDKLNIKELIEVMSN